MLCFFRKHHKDCFDDNDDNIKELFKILRSYSKYYDVIQNQKLHLSLLSSSSENRGSPLELRKMKDNWWCKVQSVSIMRDSKTLYNLLRQAFGPDTSIVPLKSLDVKIIIKDSERNTETMD